MNKKLKVVRVVTTSECVPWHLGNTLRRLPTDFEVCVVGENVSRYRASFPKVDWVDIEINRKINPISDWLAFFALCKLFIRYRPDIVHSIMPKAGLLTAIAGLICRVPVRIHTFTGQVWATKSGFTRLFFYMLDRIMVLLNTVCLTDSPSQSMFLFDRGISHGHKPLPVLGNGSLMGVELERFNDEGLPKKTKLLQKQLGINDSDFVFSFIARKSIDKGGIDVLYAFNAVLKNNPSVKLLYVGPDESDGELNRLRLANPKLFENVIDIGRVENHEEHLAISNVLCLPSYREGFGTIVIDAAALGVPTIGSNIVGLVDSIEDGKTGVLFPAGDIQRLVDIMLSFSRDKSATNCMGMCAKARVETHFTADILYMALKDIYCRASRKLK